MQLRIGTSGFQYPEWKGSFYPENLPAGRMLSFYAAKFNSTEINYTFRHLPSARSIENWSRQTPAKFTFSFKAPQRITHFARLRECEETVTAFAQAIDAMGAKRGATLFQLPPNFQKDAARLRAFLASLPANLRPAFEFRHPSWFDDETYAALRAHDAALCLAEDDDLATPRIATASFGYLRLRRAKYSPAALKQCAAFLEAQMWTTAFVYFKHEETGTGPKYGARLQKLLGAFPPPVRATGSSAKPRSAKRSPPHSSR
jgi:uncharacterized protein YecE (DUF72 family)